MISCLGLWVIAESKAFQHALKPASIIIYGIENIFNISKKKTKENINLFPLHSKVSKYTKLVQKGVNTPN